MTAPITLDQLSNASEDADSISLFANGDDTTTITSRLGEMYPSAAKLAFDENTRFNADEANWNTRYTTIEAQVNSILAAVLATPTNTPVEETFIQGTDYAPGATSITTTHNFGSLLNIMIFFGSAFQSNRDAAVSYNNTTKVLTFTGPIPVGEVIIKGVVGVPLLPYQYSAPGAGSTASDFNTIFGETISVTRYGADPTGVADSTAAFLAAKAYIESTGKPGVVHIPRGYYNVSSTLYNNRSTNVAVPIVSWKGDGVDSTRINYTGTGALFQYSGHPTAANGASFYGSIGGFTLLGNGVAGSSPMLMLYCSFFKYHDMHIEGFDYCFYGQDIDHSQFNQVTWRFNLQGFFARPNPSPTVNSTNPNQLTFVQCMWGVNGLYGVDIERGSQNVFIGCQFEENGLNGAASGQGLRLTDSGWQGGVGCVCVGCYFEGNGTGGGLGDVVLVSTTSTGLTPVQSDATYVFNGCNWDRPNPAAQTANNCLLTNFAAVATVGQQSVVLNGCTFKGFNSYTPSAARPYLNWSGAQNRNKNNFFDSGSFYQSAVEAPTDIQNPAKTFIEVTEAGNQAIPNTITTQWTLDTVVAGYSWGSTFTGGGVTIAEKGLYDIHATLTCSASMTNGYIFIQKNGVTVGVGFMTGYNVISASCSTTFNPGDNITLWFTHNTGGSISIIGSGSANSFLTICKKID